MAKSKQTNPQDNKAEEKKTEKENPSKFKRIKDISLDSDIVACLDGKPVPAPVWEAKNSGSDGSEEVANVRNIHLFDGFGSQRPGITIIDDQQQPILTVIMELDDIDNYKNPSLEGRLSFEPDDLEALEAPEAMLTHTTFTTVLSEKTSTTLTFQAFPDPNPAHFSRLYGNVKWTFTYDSEKEDSDDREKYEEETYLEIFWIYGPPGKMYKKGVWVEVLRLLDTECFGLLNIKEVILRVVNLCFGGMGLRYDVYMGAAHYVYGWIGGGFDLKGYLDKTHPFCNCYDQAAAVQTLLGALGIQVNFNCLYPFGFLRQTELVGRGRINNPFIFSKTENQMRPGILPPNDNNRRPFGEHGFCTWNNGEQEVVLDACAGPFPGNHSVQEYLEQTIDGITELYNHPHNFDKPGTISDIEVCPGVTDVHGLPAIPSIPANLRKKMKDLDCKILGENKKKGVALNISDIDKIITPLLEKKMGWKDINKRFRSGFDTASHEWNYRESNRYLQISLSASNTIQSARDIFNMMASSSQLPGLNKGGFKMPRRYQDNLYWFTPYYKITMWWYYNIFIKMVGYNFPSYLFNSITKKLRDPILDAEIGELSGKIPEMKKFSVKVESPYSKVFVDGKVSLKIFPKDEKEDLSRYAMNFFLAGECLRLTGEHSNPNYMNNKDKLYKEFTFKCTNPGFTGVGLVAVDTNTLLCSKLHWEMIHIA